MENTKYGKRKEGRWTPIRAKAQDTRANPNSWETHIVRKRWDIGLLRALSPRIMMMMMILKLKVHRLGFIYAKIHKDRLTKPPGLILIRCLWHPGPPLAGKYCHWLAPTPPRGPGGVGLMLPMARADRGSRPVYYLPCSDLGQVVNLSLSVA